MIRSSPGDNVSIAHGRYNGRLACTSLKGRMASISMDYIISELIDHGRDTDWTAACASYTHYDLFLSV